MSDKELYYDFENYDAYVDAQIARAKRTTHQTQLQTSVNKRDYIYDRLLKFWITPDDSVLCLGARDASEPLYFKSRGHPTDAIDLFSNSEEVMICDMSKIHEHEYFKDKQYDIVVIMESIEHCLDFPGLLKGLNQVCKGYIVCMSPAAEGVNDWDCARHPFMLRHVVGNPKKQKAKLEEYFPEFEAVVNESHKGNTRAFFILRKKSYPVRGKITHGTKIWDGKFNSEVEKQYKISLCTTCMGRLYNLKQTLPINIERNSSYPNLEFVIIDYNSNDGLGEWIKDNMMEHIESGLLSYYRTTEPTHFSMAHSRNIAFKVATGDIVNNLDADNFTLGPQCSVSECWASYLNKLANEGKEKVIFAKGKRAMHGRVGFFKKEFMEELCGYDENLLGYGHDDHDLVNRAFVSGYTMYYWGGIYFDRIKTTRQEKNANMERHWKVTENENKAKSFYNLKRGIVKANQGKHWGKAHLVKNFKEEIDI